jgi:nucleoside-diphosphate-sugar epimerase
MTKVLVAGATGLVGLSLVKACKEQGAEIKPTLVLNPVS